MNPNQPVGYFYPVIAVPLIPQSLSVIPNPTFRLITDPIIYSRFSHLIGTFFYQLLPSLFEKLNIPLKEKGLHGSAARHVWNPNTSPIINDFDVYLEFYDVDASTAQTIQNTVNAFFHLAPSYVLEKPFSNFKALVPGIVHPIDITLLFRKVFDPRCGSSYDSLRIIEKEGKLFAKISDELAPYCSLEERDELTAKKFSKVPSSLISKVPNNLLYYLRHQVQSSLHFIDAENYLSIDKSLYFQCCFPFFVKNESKILNMKLAGTLDKLLKNHFPANPESMFVYLKRLIDICTKFSFMQKTINNKLILKTLDNIKLCVDRLHPYPLELKNQLYEFLQVSILSISETFEEKKPLPLMPQPVSEEKHNIIQSDKETLQQPQIKLLAINENGSFLPVDETKKNNSTVDEEPQQQGDDEELPQQQEEDLQSPDVNELLQQSGNEKNEVEESRALQEVEELPQQQEEDLPSPDVNELLQQSGNEKNEVEELHNQQENEEPVQLQVVNEPSQKEEVKSITPFVKAELDENKNKEKRISEEIDTLTSLSSLPSSKSMRPPPLHPEQLLKSILTLKEYVQNSESLKKVPLDERVNHFIFLFKKDKEKKMIKGVENCFQSLLLELQQNSSDSTTLALLWIQEMLIKGTRPKAQMIYNLYKPKRFLLTGICNEMEKKLATLPPQTSSLCLEWITDQLSIERDSLFFKNFLVLLNKKSGAREQIELITRVFSKANQKEKQKLNNLLLDLLPSVSYKDSLSLYKKMEKSPEIFPLALIFQVFQQVVLMTLTKNISNDFLLEGLQLFEKKAFRPADSSLKKNFVAVFDHSHPNVKKAFHHLINRPLPSNGLSKSRLFTLCAPPLGLALWKTTPIIKRYFGNNAYCLLLGTEVTGLSIFLLAMSAYFLSAMTSLIMCKKINAPDFRDLLIQLKVLSFLLIYNPFITFEVILEGSEKDENLNSMLFLYIGGLIAIFISNRFFCSESLNRPAINLEDKKALSFVNLSSVDILATLSNVIELFEGCSTKKYHQLTYKDKPHCLSLGAARINLWVHLAANLSLFQSRRSFLHGIIMLALPCMIPYKSKAYPTVMKRLTSLYLLNVRTYPELFKSLQLKKRSFQDLTNSAVHLFLAMSEIYIFSWIFISLVEEENRVHGVEYAD